MSDNNLKRKRTHADSEEEEVFPFRFVADPLSCYIASLFKHAPPNAANLELEFRVGHFLEKKTDQRVVLPIATPAVLTCPHSAAMGMQESHWHQIIQFMKQKGTLRGAKTEDSLYSDGTRVSRCGAKKEVLDIIRKRKIATCDVVLPGLPYDLRVSLCDEQPAAMPNTEPVYRREKDRQTLDSGVLAYEVTCAKDSSGVQSFEFEVEVTKIENRNSVTSLIQFAIADMISMLGALR